ncbi:SH3-domain-containing protein [Coniochaeta ligniaria NRRL 30616]|uniref:SH3-domain-containing protein n=1 Tax=Coniochaeta ligniaria NRRL 30616 TaxID=1408157 RepID=A0A1J7JUA5_9PEZI|nr:SH3-domain-containing protein [Coniochaeta ligniaria NRRL 30616]
MVSEERQRVIETNRSLRLIKNELESLLEKGVITESAFDDIQSLLPTESSISSAPTPAQRTQGLATPSSHNRASSPAPPTAALAALSVSPPPGPPSYSQSTAAGGPPPLPGRNQPPPPPGKPVIARARALYRYAASDARDCSFERDDTIEIHEYMNADWWMGRNTRTGAEGIFPKNYVVIEADAPPAHNEKAGWNNTNTNTAYPGAYGQGAGYQPPQQPMYGAQQGGYPPPPGQVNPYNSQAPPMAVANEQEGESKVGSAGKKIGKKLGNAAIFGAGATIGSNIVNSIF